MLSWPVRDVAIYTWRVMAFSRQHLMWSVYNFRINITNVWWFRTRKQIWIRTQVIRTLNSHIAHRSWQHFQMQFLWRYGRELCFTLELIQAWHAVNDKENCKDFYHSVYPGEAKMCLDFMSFRAPTTSQQQQNCHNTSDMQPIITQFQVLFKFMKRQLLTIVSK